MKLKEFDKWVRSILEFELTEAIDSSLNGIQVGNMEAEIGKIAFAVDACMDSFLWAKQEGAQILFVHHGLFWGPAKPVTGVHGERIRFLVNNNLALYACHLPLDRHPLLGNNARMAYTLGLKDLQQFGDYKGIKIGCKGWLPSGMNLESIVSRLFDSWDSRINALRYGQKEIFSVGMISGSGTENISQAIEEGLDLYITGDSSHNIYHECRESGINVLFAGHYLTETFGVRAIAELVKSELGLKSVFLDIPTGY